MDRHGLRPRDDESVHRKSRGCQQLESDPDLQEFLREAKLSMAVKLFEMKRLSSGMAASLIGMSRVEFLAELHRYGVAMIDLDQDDLAQDLVNA